MICAVSAQHHELGRTGVAPARYRDRNDGDVGRGLTTIKTQSPPFSRPIEARPSRSIEACVVTRNFGSRLQHHRYTADTAGIDARPRQSQQAGQSHLTGRSVAFERARLLPAWGDNPKIGLHIANR
jgi:hypothetical protein